MRFGVSEMSQLKYRPLDNPAFTELVAHHLVRFRKGYFPAHFTPAGAHRDVPNLRCVSGPGCLYERPLGPGNQRDPRSIVPIEETVSGCGTLNVLIL